MGIVTKTNILAYVAHTDLQCGGAMYTQIGLFGHFGSNTHHANSSYRGSFRIATSLYPLCREIDKLGHQINERYRNQGILVMLSDIMPNINYIHFRKGKIRPNHSYDSIDMCSKTDGVIWIKPR